MGPTIGNRQSLSQPHPEPVPGESTATTDNSHELSPAEHGEKPDELALSNADNPLQLLAMASVLPAQSPSTTMSTPAGFVTQQAAVK